MDQSALSQYSVLLNPARLVSVSVFLVGFMVSVYFWFIRDSGKASLRLFFVSFHHNRRELLRRFFNEGPGYLLFPLWLIFASFCENIFGTMLVN